jgi:flagellar biosynthesis GTPase FlhF
MRALLALASLALVACGDPPPAKSPQPAGPDPVVEAAARAQREAREQEVRDRRERAAAEAAQERDAEQERARLQRVAQSAREEEFARRQQEQRRQQEAREEANERVRRADWIMHDLTWRSADAQSVANIWFAYGQLSRSARTHEIRMDAVHESRPLMDRDDEASNLARIFGRRAFADSYTAGLGLTVGPESKTLVTSADWDQCMKYTPRNVAKDGKAFRDIGFTDFMCMKLKEGVAPLRPGRSAASSMG